MIVCEWRNFSTDTETYTLETFEEMIGDEFEAMMFEDGQEIPSYIWTTNYVVIVKRNTRMYKDISFTKIPRNPVCE
jgi:glutamate synthase domain-containing protein 1